MERFQKIGNQLMHRSGSTARYDATLGDRAKRDQVAGLLGQCFVIAWNTIRVEPRRRPRPSPTASSTAVELYGDDVVDLLNERAPAQARNRRPGRERHGP